MSKEVKVPVLPESVEDAVVAAWHKKPGDFVSRDENLVDLETDKVVLEVPAPMDGVIKELKAEEGETVNSGQVLAILEEGGPSKEDESEKSSEGGSEEAAAGGDTGSDAGEAEAKPTRKKNRSPRQKMVQVVKRPNRETSRRRKKQKIAPHSALRPAGWLKKNAWIRQKFRARDAAGG
jgi:2-oxoglutarate dehydrogenase E2 component (dihydrolipoamide succinyltransferase)